MNKKGSNIIVQLLIVSGVAMMIFYLFAFRETTHQGDFAACTASCHEKKMLGKLVKRDEPASPKPSAQKFDCVCW